MREKGLVGTGEFENTSQRGQQQLAPASQPTQACQNCLLGVKKKGRKPRKEGRKEGGREEKGEKKKGKRKKNEEVKKFCNTMQVKQNLQSLL